MKLAFPTYEGKLCSHFGHCDRFAIIEVADDEIVGEEIVTPPPHEPGVLPAWLNEKGVNVIIAGGMGQRAQSLFKSYSIDVIVGIQPDYPKQLAEKYISGNLAAGNNPCDH